MKRKTAYITAGVGCALVVGFSPLFISWAYSRKLDANPRAHYVAGLGHIAGWIGRDGNRAALYAQAERIERDVVVVRFYAESEDELNELIRKARVRRSYDTRTHEIDFEFPREFAEQFQRELTEFQNNYKSAQQDASHNP